MSNTMPNPKVATRWTSGLSDQQKERFLQALRNDTLVLGRLKEILSEDLLMLHKKESKIDSYESPSWAYRQAHINGAKQTTSALLELLSFLK